MPNSSIFQINTLAFDNADMSTDLASPILDLAEVAGYAVDSVFSGTPSGTLQVMGSNALVVANFVPVDEYIITEEGVRLLNVEKTHYRYVYINFINNSGTGSLTSRVSGKRI